MKKITNYVLMITAALLLSFVPLHSSAQCNYSVSLYDTYGDGWNGGILDVMVNGSVVVNDVTIGSGYGPVTYFFAVNTGDMITTDYTAGSWSSENYYRIFNSTGVQVFGTPAGSTPTDLVAPGVTAVCPPPVGDVMGHVYNGDGVAIAGADVTVEGFGFRTTDALGAYSFVGLPSGATDMTASKDGWNDVTQTVTVISSNTVTADFTLTKPSLTINPLMYDEILNPNEYLTKFLGMLNIGDGPAGWTAEVVYPETNNSNNLTERQAELNAMTSHGDASIQDATNSTQTLSDRDYTTCPDGSIFSNAPVGTDNGYTSILYSGYYCAQQFNTSAAIGSVTVWALYSGAQPQDFKVDFYADGSTPGALVNSYTVTGISGLNTGIVLYGFPMYQFTIPVPSTSLASGYVSVVAQLGNSPWYWSNTYSGTGSAYQMVGGSWLALSPSMLAVCLGPASGGGGGGGDWLTLGQYEGTVGPNGTSFNLPVNFDATGTAAGEVYNAEIHITTDPNVGTFTVPVTMTIYGDPLSPVTDLTATLTNEVTGAVSLSWTFTRPANFQYFLIKRDGLGIGTTTNTSYSDILPGYDTYCYTVTPVYDAGNGVPGGPACLDWLIPVLCYSPAAPENSQWPLTQEEVGLTIENCGEGTLEFSFPDYAAQLLLNNPNIQKNDVSPVEGFDKMAEPAKGESDPRDGGGHPVVLGAGGPDTFGYEWIDSDETGGPVYNWVEISGTGTNHGLVGDDNYSTITLPFAFPFYGVDKTSLLAGTNGYLTFGTSGTTYSNTAIPNASVPNDIIAAFWDDLNFVSGTSFLYSYYDAANSRFIIEYKNVPKLGASLYNTFQYILTPNGGITIQYQSMNGVLNSATVGIENTGGTDGLQVAYNTAYVANNKAVYFFQPAHFITSVNPYYGTISEGNSQDITMVYSSADYGVGTYTEDLFISTNEQGTNEWFIPNTMHVYQPASISGTVTDCVTGAPKKNVTVTANPLSAINQWLYYDDGNSIDAIGGPATFSWAIKFDPAQLAGFDGTSLTKIMLYNYVSSAGELRIYKGANAATLLHTQTLSGQAVGTWSEINLNSAVALDVTQELWITIYTTVGATYPASCCNATGQPNGDLITLDGVTWDHLTDYALPYTWSLRGFVTNASGALVSLPMDAPKDNYDATSRISLGASGVTANHPIPEELASRVAVNSYTTETAENGTYTLVVDPGTYDVEFSLVGFHTVTVEDVVVTVATSPVDVDAQMCEMAYPPSFVFADPNEADTEALITWGIPMGPYTIIYDDGTAENFFSFLPYGSATAVKFTPAGYPANVTGGCMFVGDGSFPEGVDFIGAQVSVGVVAADGANGMPGTVLDSTTITVDNYGWIHFDNALNATIESGNFYIAVWKLLMQVPVGVDQNVPTYYRSYVKPAGGNWTASSYQDFMIRAIVDGPGTNVAERISGQMIYPAKPNMTDFVATCAPSGVPGVEKNGIYKAIDNQDASRELVDYAVARINGFDPNVGEGPEDGTPTIIAAHNATQSYNDAGFGGQAAGYYAYAVRANYSLENSEWVYSNVVAHGLDNVVTLNVSRCDGGDVSGTEVHLLGHNYPFQHLMATTDASGVIVFDSVINGIYDLSANKMGFQPYEHFGILINYDYTEDVVLANKTYPAKNLFVEPLTSVATWEAPNYTAVEIQNFEDATFPPAGWAMESNSRGFFRTNAGGSSFFPIPAGDGYYACANDDGFNGDASIDRLILPVCDLREGASYNFAFDYFYDGSWGGSAYVEYSTDGGANWTVLQSLNAVGDWTTQSVSLASFAGEDALTLCFHYDDNGMWADGIAVDNVSVSNGAVDILGYEISLNNGYITEVGPEILTYEYRNLTYGQTYTATVKAKFPCGLSEPVNYVFQSTYLYPPRNIADAYVYNTNEIPMMWNPPVSVAGPARLSNVDNSPVTSVGVASKGAIPAGLVQSVDNRPNQYLNPLDSYNAWIEGPNGGTPATLYVADMATYGYTVVGNSLVDPSTGDFMNDEDTYMLCAGDWGATLYSVDVTTGASTLIAPFSGGFSDVSGMSVDRATNTMYVCMTSVSASQIGTLDVETGVITPIGSQTTEAPGLIQIAIDGSGQMYGWDIVNDATYLIDKATGVVTYLGSLGFDANYGQGGNWSAEDDIIYLTAFNNSTFQGELRALDVTTGGTTFLGVLPQLQCTAFGVPASGSSGGGGGVPAGLVSFNLYQDGELLVNVPYEGQSPDEFVNYVINPIDPGTYS
ncbi:MAG: carboxypeptidase regulatory-like domain-containing protein, partial [Bacteroidales bacterium]